MLLAQAEKDSMNPLSVNLSFRLYITNYQNLSFVGAPEFPVRASVNLPADVSLTTADISTAGQAIISAAGNASLQEAAALQQAQQGAAQQASGFGGASSLTQALQQGVTSTGNPSIDEILQNAAEAVQTGQGRTLPLRGLISDNVDEYTALLPPTAPTYSPTDINSEVTDLQQTLVQQADFFGADINDPLTFGDLGMLPFFGAFVPFGLFGGIGLGASFGVSGFSSNSFGGINGGLGFTGSFTGSPSFTSSIQAQAQQNAAVGVSASAGAPVYGNGVPVSGGVIGGQGAGGGIPGGYSSEVGSPVTVGASPGGVQSNGVGAAAVASSSGGTGLPVLQQYIGGPNFQAGASGFSTSGGYASSGAGASINVGGSPTLFSMAIVSGTLTPFTPITDSHDFFIGPDGNVSQTNTTGVTI